MKTMRLAYYGIFQQSRVFIFVLNILELPLAACMLPSCLVMLSNYCYKHILIPSLAKSYCFLPACMPPPCLVTLSNYYYEHIPVLPKATASSRPACRFHAFASSSRYQTIIISTLRQSILK